MEPFLISYTWLAVWGAAAGVLLEDPVERDEELPGEVQRAHRVRHRRVERHQDERPANGGTFPIPTKIHSEAFLWHGWHPILLYQFRALHLVLTRPTITQF